MPRTLSVAFLFFASTVFHVASTGLLSAPPRGAYLHIPFCRRRCFYCDFPIEVIGDRASTRERETEAYISLLHREIRSATRDLAPLPPPLETVYFGGGTPSLLSPLQVGRTLELLASSQGLAADAEVTLEMDPGTFDLAALRAFQQAGVTRVSMGVQSFSDVTLRASGRAHTAADVAAAVGHMHAAGLDNFSIDLISSLPAVDAAAWEATLHAAVATGCAHVSVYDLQVEEGTAFGRWYKPGVFPLPSDAESAAMYEAAISVLGSAGFEHYEISNYARAGRRSRHNQQYWRCAPVWGFGLGAASFVDRLRVTRPSRMEAYAAWVARAEREGYSRAVGALASDAEAAEAAEEAGEEREDGESRDAAGATTLPEQAAGQEREAMLDEIMLSLRTADGLSLPGLRDRHGALGADGAERVLRAVEAYAGQGLVDVSGHEDGQTVRLTDPRGFLLSNDVISSIFAEF